MLHIPTQLQLFDRTASNRNCSLEITCGFLEDFIFRPHRTMLRSRPVGHTPHPSSRTVAFIELQGNCPVLPIPQEWQRFIVLYNES